MIRIILLCAALAICPLQGLGNTYSFETLEKMCQALKCQPGDVLALANGKKDATKTKPGPGVRKKQR